MRLRHIQADEIKSIVREYVGPANRIYLFGSRTDDSARGGDVDLLIETPRDVSRIQRARLKMRLEAVLGLPVDVLIKPRNKNLKPFEKIALRNAELLTDGYENE
jgi:predicted nucleotidyltransferase